MRDALATIGGLLRASARLAADRIVPPRGIPARAAGVDAAWLTAVLQPSFPGARVKSVERLDGNDGTTSRVRLALTPEGEPGVPASVFVKLPPADLATRLDYLLAGFGWCIFLASDETGLV